MSSTTFAARLGLAAAITALAACSAGQQSSQLPVTVSAAGGASATGGGRAAKHLRAFAANCSATAAVVETGNCTNIELVGTALGPTTAAAAVPGFHPADLQSAYKLPSATSGGGQTIGIVVVGINANLEKDLGVYRSTFGLPACTSASGCLHVMAGAAAVAADSDWGHEAAIDVDMASATCPKCKLLVIEVGDRTALSLIAGDSAAARNGATVISDSFAIPESPHESSAIWQHTGVPVVAAAGDLGYGAVNWPAAASGVIAVGATTLTAGSTARGWTETPWAGTGSGCSTIAAKPAWQKDVGCALRTVADVAAVGDPQTPVAVYDSYLDTGWIQMGGTSVSAPIVAGVIALAGNAAQLNGADSIYTHAANLFPVGTGSNGTCTALYLCNVMAAGYSGPAGIGTPNGVAAF